jgi:hypothetical protein
LCLRFEVAARPCNGRAGATCGRAALLGARASR